MGIFDAFRKRDKSDDALINQLREEIKKEIDKIDDETKTIGDIDSAIKKALEKYSQDVERQILEKLMIEDSELGVIVKSEYEKVFRKPTNRIEVCKEIDAFVEENPEAYNAVKLYASYMLYGSGELKLETYKVKVITKNKELEKKAYDIIKSFDERSRIKQKLYMICQELFKFGDAFMEVIRTKDGKIVNVVRIPSNEVIPIVDPRTEEVIKLYQIADDNVDINRLFHDTEYLNEMIRQKKVIVFEKDEFIHFSDGTPVGAQDAPLRNLTITWKILKLLEESLVVHRITRAKRLIVFLLDVTGKTPIQIKKYIARFKQALQSIFTTSLESGTIYRGRSTIHYGTDIIIPIRKDSATKVQTIPADTSASKIEDLQYYYNRILDALLVSHVFGVRKTGKEEQIENAFYRFIRTYQAQLSFALKSLYKDVLRTHGIDDDVDIAIIFPSPDVKEELKLIDTILRRVMVINQLIAVIGVIPPRDWIVNYVFKDLTQDEIRELLNKLQQEEEKYSETTPIEPVFEENESNKETKENDDFFIFRKFIKELPNEESKTLAEKSSFNEFVKLYMDFLEFEKRRSRW